MKRCSRCGQEKDLNQFGPDQKTLDGRFCWCRECRRAWDREYGRANPEKIRQRNHKWHAAHRQEDQTRCRVYHQRQKQAVYDYYGHQCACCGENRPEFLAIDHINNDGATHRRETGRVNIHVWLVRHGFPPGFQVLCRNCNRAKFVYGVCPHERERLLQKVAI